MRAVSVLFLLGLVFITSCKTCDECEVYASQTGESLDSLVFQYPTICGFEGVLDDYARRCHLEWEEAEDTVNNQIYVCDCHELD